MKRSISFLVAGALLMCALPALAQPDAKAVNGLPYPLVSPEDAAKLEQPDKPISLHLRDVAISAALDELQKQSGVELSTSTIEPEVLAKHLSLDIETSSFNEALDAISDEADVKAHLERKSASGPLNVVFDENNLPDLAPQSGTKSFSFRVPTLIATIVRSVELDKIQRRNLFMDVSLTLQCKADPLLPVVGAAQVHITRAEDDQGHSLRDQQPFQLTVQGLFRPIAVLTLNPQPDSHTVAHLDGVAVWVLATKKETYQVDDVLHTKSVEHDFVFQNQILHVNLTCAPQNDTDVQVTMEVRSDTKEKPAELDRMRFGLLSDAQVLSWLRLSDATGRQLSSSAVTKTKDDNTLTVKALFGLSTRFASPKNPQGQAAPAPAQTPALNEPLKLIMDVPTEFVQTEVPFSFSDLPLP